MPDNFLYLEMLTADTGTILWESLLKKKKKRCSNDGNEDDKDEGSKKCIILVVLVLGHLLNSLHI